MYTQRDVCKGRSGLNQIIHESMLHVETQALYMMGVLQGVVGVDPVCIGGSVLQGWTGIKTGCSTMQQHSQDSAGKARKNRIAG